MDPSEKVLQIALITYGSPTDQYKAQIDTLEAQLQELKSENKMILGTICDCMKMLIRFQITERGRSALRSQYKHCSKLLSRYEES